MKKKESIVLRILRCSFLNDAMTQQTKDRLDNVNPEAFCLQGAKKPVPYLTLK